MGQGHSGDSASKSLTVSSNNFVLRDPGQPDYRGNHAHPPISTQIPDNTTGNSQTVAHPYLSAPYFLPEGDLHTESKKGKKKKDKKRKFSSASNSQSNSLFDPNQPNPYAVALDPVTGRYVYYPPYPLIGYPATVGRTHMGPDGTLYSSEGAIYEEIRGQGSRTSVVISTHPDPKQVTIKRESNKGSTVAVIENGLYDDNNNNNTAVINMDNNNNKNNKNNSNNNILINGGDDKDDVPGIVIGGETISVDSQTVVSSSSGLYINGMLVDPKRAKKFAASNTRESKYVTYIRDAPRPPTPSPPPQPVEQLITTEMQEEVGVALSVSSHITDAEALETEGFIEVGVVNEAVTKVFLDEETVEHVISGERLVVERSQDKQTGLEEQMATVSFSEINSVDVVLCYDSQGARLAGRVKDALECLDLSVMMGALWEDVSQDDVLNIARYVLTAPILVTVLTPGLVSGRYIRDLVSLAKATNRLVWPLSIDGRETVEENMAAELRLQVSRLRWTQVAREGVVSTAKLRFLARSARDVIQSWRVRDIIDEDWGEVSSWAVRHQQVLRRITESRNVEKNITEAAEEEYRDEDVTPPETPSRKMTATKFWDQTFPQDVNVPWDHFRSQLRSHYLTELTTQLPRTSMPPLMEILKQELTVTSERGEQVVSRAKFVAFCTNCGEDQDVWQTLFDVAGSCQAVIDVLATDSTVRAVAIEAIGHHGSPFVVSSLRDLLRDPDEEVRSLAVTSLSRCMLSSDQQSFQALMIALDDREWTIRRAACLAMANIGAVDSADRLRRLWRHDLFHPVRHAASLALVQLGMDVKAQIPPLQTVN